MTANLQLSPNLTLPSAYVTGKAALLGRTGSGKTNTAVVLGEQMIERCYPLAILDPQGDWWGLRSKYKIVIMGGEHGDIPLDPAAGELAADFMVEHRVPVLFDLFKMGEGEMVRFATDFARRLWTKNRDALHVFLDEADLFAPQRDLKGPKAACLGAWQNIVRRGRSRGIGCTMITQRSAVLNKDLLTQADPLIVHRLTAPQDLAAVDAYLDAHGISREMAKGILTELAAYKVGEACVISPGTLGIPPTRIKVGHRHSFDSSATPEVGKAAAKPKDLASIDLGALSKQFAATIEKAKADDPKELKKRIAELERDLRAKPAAAVDPAALERVITERDRFWTGQLLEVKEQADDAFKRLDVAAATLKAISARAQSLDESAKNRCTMPIIGKPGSAIGHSANPIGKPITKQVNPNPPPRSKTDYQTGKSNGDVNLGKCERAILQVLSQFPDGCDSGKLTLLSGYRFSGGFRNSLSALRSAGLIAGGNGDVMTITAEGDAMGPFDPLPEGDALIRYWLNHTSISGCGKKILQALIEVPDGLTADEICRSTGYEFSGGFRNALSELRTAGLIVGKNTGTMQLSPHLLEAAGA